MKLTLRLPGPASFTVHRKRTAIRYLEFPMASWTHFLPLPSSDLSNIDAVKLHPPYIENVNRFDDIFYARRINIGVGSEIDDPVIFSNISSKIIELETFSNVIRKIKAYIRCRLIRGNENRVKKGFLLEFQRF